MFCAILGIGDQGSRITVERLQYSCEALKPRFEDECPERVLACLGQGDGQRAAMGRGCYPLEKRQWRESAWSTPTE